MWSCLQEKPMGNSFLQILLGFLNHFQASLSRTAVFESQGVSRCYLGSFQSRFGRCSKFWIIIFVPLSFPWERRHFKMDSYGLWLVLRDERILFWRAVRDVLEMTSQVLKWTLQVQMEAVGISVGICSVRKMFYMQLKTWKRGSKIISKPWKKLESSDWS